jgi:hypothetical protein
MDDLDAPSIKVETAREIISTINPTLVGSVVNRESAQRIARSTMEGIRQLMSKNVMTEMKKVKTIGDLVPPEVMAQARKEYVKLTKANINKTKQNQK